MPGHNSLRDEMVLGLGDVQLVLRPTFDALVAIEASTGRGIIPLARRLINRDATLSDIVAVLSAATRAAGGDPPADLGPRVIEHGLGEVMAALSGFLARAITPKGKPVGAGETTAP